MKAPEAPSGFRPKSSRLCSRPPLGSGTVGVQYKLKMAGWDAAALFSSASAETAFTWTGGALKVSPDARTPLRVLTGKGKAALDKDGWTISASQWKTPTGIYHLSGQRIARFRPRLGVLAGERLRLEGERHR